ncbi:hypothetical protein HK097_004733, partial [Rhizophlyctis rosea]
MAGTEDIASRTPKVHRTISTTTKLNHYASILPSGIARQFTKRTDISSTTSSSGRKRKLNESSLEKSRPVAKQRNDSPNGMDTHRPRTPSLISDNGSAQSIMSGGNYHSSPNKFVDVGARGAGDNHLVDLGDGGGDGSVGVADKKRRRRYASGKGYARRTEEKRNIKTALRCCYCSGQQDIRLLRQNLVQDAEGRYYHESCMPVAESAKFEDSLKSQVKDPNEIEMWRMGVNERFLVLNDSLNSVGRHRSKLKIWEDSLLMTACFPQTMMPALAFSRAPTPKYSPAPSAYHNSLERDNSFAFPPATSNTNDDTHERLHTVIPDISDSKYHSDEFLIREDQPSVDLPFKQDRPQSIHQDHYPAEERYDSSVPSTPSRRSTYPPVPRTPFAVEEPTSSTFSPPPPSTPAPQTPYGTDVPDPVRRPQSPPHT